MTARSHWQAAVEVPSVLAGLRVAVWHDVDDMRSRGKHACVPAGPRPGAGQQWTEEGPGTWAAHDSEVSLEATKGGDR